MALLCFDVDGTLVPGIGPIAVNELHELKAAGHRVVIVSPSPLRPAPPPFPEYLSVDRKKNLLDAQAANPGERPVYISDNEGDDHLSAEVAFEYVHPNYWAAFREKLDAQHA